MQKLPNLRTKIPGQKSRLLAQKLKKFEAPTVTCISSNGPIFWQRASGIHIWDVDGNRYIDLTSAFGVASLGHSNPKIVTAIQDQSTRLCHAMGDVHPAELKARLCAKLSDITFERWTQKKFHAQTLFGNSGFEAVEIALKTAMLFTRKRGIIAFQNSYHGLGYGALETTWRSDFRDPFRSQLGHFTEFVSYPQKSGGENEQQQLQEVEKQIKDILSQREVGAILVEPFQGRGGEVIPPDGFLPMLRRLCDRNRILLIVDEIYVGFWRTGCWFAVEHSGVIPDLICLGKALSGSLPLSACVGRSDVMAAWPESKGEALHTSTFSGNPLACAAALASIKEFESQASHWKILEKGKKTLKQLSNSLSKEFGVKEVRGIGLLMGIEFLPAEAGTPSIACDQLLRKYGIIALPSGSSGEVLALTPPLMIEEDTLEWCIKKIVASIMRNEK